MLPNGEVVKSTTTQELLTFTSGMNNIIVMIAVTELSEVKTSKNGLVYMHIFGTNDEEEPLRINIWRKPATDKIIEGIKPGGLYKFEGVKVGPTKPQFQYGSLPYDLHWYEWGNFKFISAYSPKSLPLKAPHDINPQCEWRLRCRGVVSQDFTRYMRYSSALMGMMRVREDLQFQVTMRSVPMAYWNSFTKNTEIEVVGHVRKNDGVWDLDVSQWTDVRNSSSLPRNATAELPPHSPKTPDTPLTPKTENAFFVNSAGTPSSSTASLQNGAYPATPSSTFLGAKENVEAMLIQSPVWDVPSNCYILIVSIAHNGKPRVVKVVTTQMLHALVEQLIRGVKVELSGTISQTRSGFTMDASTVTLASSRKKKALPDALPTTFSNAEDINGANNDWHKVHVDIISEFAYDDQASAYSGYVNIHGSAKGIFVHLKNVPDEAVPRLSLFEELDIMAPVSGDDDSLEMIVEWKHAAFHSFSDEFQKQAMKTVAPLNNKVPVSPSSEAEVRGGKTSDSTDSSPAEDEGKGKTDDCHADKQNKASRKRPSAREPKVPRSLSERLKKNKAEATGPSNETSKHEGNDGIADDIIIVDSGLQGSLTSMAPSAASLPSVVALTKIKEEPTDLAFAAMSSTSIPTRKSVYRDVEGGSTSLKDAE